MPINVDGLFAFKDSTQQLWPILDLMVRQRPSVFLIGLLMVARGPWMGMDSRYPVLPSWWT